MKTLTAAFAAAVLAAAGPAAAEDDHPPLPAAIERFHDVLAPVWHAAPGAERNEAACGNVEQYVARARDIAALETPAGGDAGLWNAATAALLDASAALGAYCTTGFDRNVSAGLTTLHDRFHGVMELLEP